MNINWQEGEDATFSESLPTNRPGEKTCILHRNLSLQVAQEQLY